uniref:Uncharacterized protein n=1 Tax=Nelumbo nucifera TaxID=4432 RepID=A0A822Y9S2_NELNU|nr:TPA_asm: hypothetical protein HUJ06_030615 [Nelumbo nucifera]
MPAVFDVIEKLAIKSDDVEIKLNKELILFENCRGNIGRPFLVKTFMSMPPGEWWSIFGCDTPKLKMIVRMNRLEKQRLNDLVYVHCNLHVMDGRKTESLDPIRHEHVDVVEDWIMHNDEDPSLLDVNEKDDMFKADETTFPIMESPSRKRARTEDGDDEFFIEQWGIIEENATKYPSW